MTHNYSSCINIYLVGWVSAEKSTILNAFFGQNKLIIKNIL